MFAVWAGAGFIVIGMVWAAITTAQRGRLSDTRPPMGEDIPDTLEPGGRGRQLSLVADLPAFALIIIGVVLLFIGPLT